MKTIFSFTLMRLTISLLSVLFYLPLQAQYENNNWFIGADVCLCFNKGASPPTTFKCKGRYDLESMFTLSDEKGELMLYNCNSDEVKDGDYILRGADGNIVENGDSILMNGIATNGIVSVWHKKSNLVYVFSLSIEYFDGVKDLNLYYSIYDPTLNKITKKNILLNDNKMVQKVFAIQHANGQDWWLITHKYNSTTFVKYLVTGDSIIFSGEDSTGSVFGGGTTFNWFFDYNPGEVSVAKSGDKFLMVDYFGKMNIFSFDRCTGKINLHTDLDFLKEKLNVVNYFGASFSNDGNKIYFGSCQKWIPDTFQSGLANHIFQYDLVSNKSYVVDTIPYQYWFTEMEMGLDGKLYIGMYLDSTLKDYLAVVHSPDSLGEKCGYVRKGLFLNRPPESFTNGVYGLPNTVNYNLPTLSAGQPNSAGQDVAIEKGGAVQLGLPAQPNMTYAWASEPPDTTLSCTDCPQPTASPDTNTTYYLTLTDTTKPRGDACSFGVYKVRVSIKKPEARDELSRLYIKIYPNPAQNNFTVAHSESASHEIVNLVGQTVYQTELKNAAATQISTEGWPNGAYLCRIIQNGVEVGYYKVVVSP